MNYRHAYHAGNFADVLKHAVLALVIEHLKLKPAPFRVIDTHAGVGRYDLAGEEAQKTGEWRDGIGRMLAEPLPDAVERILAPLLAAVAAENPGRSGADITCYPGSPLIARHLMRAGDTLVVNELHPDDHAELAKEFARDRATKVLALDGWIALRSLLPPKERRGLVLIDPPYEVAGELARLVTGLAEGLQRFAGGTFIAWYPIKDLRPIAAFREEARELPCSKLLCVELMVRHAEGRTGSGLAGCGLLIANPPYTLPAALEVLMPFLASRLAQEAGGSWRAGWMYKSTAATVKPSR